MSIRISFTRAGAIGLAGLVLLFSAAQPAAAKQDWLGWLEEFSGPGPFEGFELSVEFACLNVTHRDTVSRAELLRQFPQVALTANKAKASLLQFNTVLTTLSGYQLRPFEAKKEGSAEPDIDQLVARVQADIDAGKLEASESVKATVRTAWNDLLAFRTVTAEALRKAPSVTKQGLKTYGGRSCWGSKAPLDKDRSDDRRMTAEAIDVLLQGAPATDEELHEGRRDWQTGLVVDFGWFWSEQNRLFDPDGTRDDATEPRLRVIPLEFLAHQKLSPAIDVGAGLGVALLSTNFRSFPERPTKPAALYLVPLSVVVRPGKLFTDKRWAAALGYRVNVKYFGDLEGKDFGRPPADLLPGEKYFKQHGEFVWGAAMFFDLWSAAGR